MNGFVRLVACVLIAVSIAVVSGQLVFAEVAEQTQKVLSSGFGISIDKAKENAIRNAVEQVIGSYVTSDSLVTNNQLVKDEILFYSGGYVKEMKVVSQENKDGSFTVQIEATVISIKLKRKLESLNIATKKVEGESLFGEASSKISEQNNASELLARTLAKYPQAAYVFEVGKPEVKSTDTSKNTAEIRIPLTIRWDNAFINELKDVVSRITLSGQKMKDMEWLQNRWAVTRDVNSKNVVLCFSTKGIVKNGIAESCNAITYQLYKDAIVKGNLQEKANLIHLPVDGSDYSLLLLFKNKEGNILSTDTYVFSRDNADSTKRQDIPYDNQKASRNDTYSISYSLLKGEGFTPPNTLWRDLWGRNVLLLTDGVFMMTADVNIEVSQLGSISSIDVQFNPFR